MSPISNGSMSTQYGLYTRGTAADVSIDITMNQFLNSVTQTMTNTTAQGNESFVPFAFSNFLKYFYSDDLGRLIECVNTNIEFKGIDVDQTVLDRLEESGIGVDLTCHTPKF